MYCFIWLQCMIYRCKVNKFFDKLCIFIVNNSLLMAFLATRYEFEPFCRCFMVQIFNRLRAFLVVF